MVLFNSFNYEVKPEEISTPVKGLAVKVEYCVYNDESIDVHTIHICPPLLKIIRNTIQFTRNIEAAAQQHYEKSLITA